jgi:uncharacterized protein (DUF1697 family)
VATYIAFLRAINLGRNRKVPMADARVWLAEAGLGDVETYIQTGNVRFTTTLRSRSKVERVVEEVLEERCGFDVPTIAFTPVELRAVHAEALSLAPPIDDVARQYVTFLKDEPTPEAAAPIDGGTTPARQHVWRAVPCTGGCRRPPTRRSSATCGSRRLSASARPAT